MVVARRVVELLWHTMDFTRATGPVYHMLLGVDGAVTPHQHPRNSQMLFVGDAVREALAGEPSVRAPRRKCSPAATRSDAKQSAKLTSEIVDVLGIASFEIIVSDRGHRLGIPSLETRDLLWMGELELLDQFGEGHVVAAVVDHRPDGSGRPARIAIPSRGIREPCQRWIQAQTEDSQRSTLAFVLQALGGAPSL
jgi:hypothetical protein